MKNWVDDYIDIGWVSSFEIENDPKGSIQDPSILKDEIGTGYFSPIKSTSWKKMNMHRSQAKYIATNEGNRLMRRKYREAVGTPEYLNYIIPSLRPQGYE
jgi:hypothetical protein